MIRSLGTAVSGLRNHQIKLDVIGNNIANVNTVAFKNSQVRFEDLFSQTLQGASAPLMRGGINPSQVGLGMRISTIVVNHLPGAIQTTDRVTDLAIEGAGFFVVSDGRELFYTRDGSFGLDAAGELVNGSGLKVMGWTGSYETAELSPIHIPLGERMVARATSRLYFSGNLDARAWETGGDHNFGHYVFDSLGRRYHVEFAFTPTDQNRWSYQALLDGNVIGSGELVYDQWGFLDREASTLAPIVYTPPGAEPLEITPYFDDSTQLAGSGSLLVRWQDGFPSGELVAFSISSSGEIIGSYTNGMVESLGQIALAFFTNPEGLLKQGGNLYRLSANSGEARIGLPGTEGRGLIRSSSLEMSNTDLSLEFTELITTSRAFQANARVISTSDEVLVEVVNMKR